MATSTFTSAGVNNLASNAANWDNVPADTNPIVIPTGQTCEWDIDTSGYATGIDGLTITGTLKLSRTTSGYIKMKAAKTITGAGTFDCGASALDAIPFAVKHTVTGGAGWYINGAAGLTMTVYAAEPAIKTILLSGNEAIGQTELSVDTSVVGDIWADGDTIRINNIDKGKQTEERIIAAGGIAADTITITAGLTAAKITGTVISLISRNVTFLSSTASTFVGQNFAAGKLTIAGGRFKTSTYYAFNACTSPSISGGVFDTNDTCFYQSVSVSVSGGVFSGNNNVINSCTGTNTISGGVLCGNGYSINISNGALISGGTHKGNTTVVYNCIGITASGFTILGCGNGFYACTGANVYDGSITSCGNGFINSSVSVNNVTLSNNSYDVNQSIISAYNTLFGSATEFEAYTNLSKGTYSESIDHDQQAGAYKAWTKGGVTTRQAVTYPSGKTYAMQTVLASASVEGFWQKEITVGAGASVNITMYLRKSASMAYLPRVIIFNKASTDPFAGGTGLNTFTMTNSVDTWESSLYTYTNSTSEDITLVIRTQGMNASGNLFSYIDVEQINVDLTSAIALLNTIATDTTTDIPALIAALPTAVENRQEMDSNSTRLATIAGDTTTDIPALIGALEGFETVLVGGYTGADLFRVFASILAGKVSGGGTTTIVFRSIDDTKNVITATVDTNGNRVNVVVDAD